MRAGRGSLPNRVVSSACSSCVRGKNGLRPRWREAGGHPGVSRVRCRVVFRLGGRAMPCTVVVGAQWGDEGKGKIVDALAERADIVARYQGGPNAGHSVKIGRASCRESVQIGGAETA